jgi:heme O synthase-like polyprenyltransferase
MLFFIGLGFYTVVRACKNSFFLIQNINSACKKISCFCVFEKKRRRQDFILSNIILMVFMISLSVDSKFFF